ncbi:MAG: hypothetical protein ACRDKH_00510, partial [Solirubrobacterales bacterium]
MRAGEGGDHRRSGSSARPRPCWPGGMIARRMSRRGALSIALTAVVLAAGLGAGCGDDGDEGPDDAAERRSLLYVADARSGTLIGRSNDDYILRLEGLASSIVGFSDRPNRVTLNVPTEDFFASWDAKFAGDPPNAALDISGAARGDASAFELTNPRLSG